jgi:hypothetical protein
MVLEIEITARGGFRLCTAIDDLKDLRRVLDCAFLTIPDMTPTVPAYIVSAREIKITVRPQGSVYEHTERVINRNMDTEAERLLNELLSHRIIMSFRSTFVQIEDVRTKDVADTVKKLFFQMLRMDNATIEEVLQTIKLDINQNYTSDEASSVVVLSEPPRDRSLFMWDDSIEEYVGRANKYKESLHMTPA